MIRRKRVWVLLAALAGVPAAASVETLVTPHVEASLLADVERVAAGRAFWLALRLQLQPGWHVYWRNPGDSGLAPRIDWTLPPAMAAGDIRWPLPERFRFQSLMSFGYAGEVLLLTRASALPGLAGAEQVTITADAEWLVCKHVCVPEEGRLALTLPVAAAPRPDPAGAAAIAAALVRLPGAAAAEAGFEARADTLVLRVPLARPAAVTDAWFYPLEYGVVEHAAAQSLRRTTTGVELTLVRGDLRFQDIQRLRGVLAVQADGPALGLNIDAARLP